MSENEAPEAQKVEGRMGEIAKIETGTTPEQAKRYAASKLVPEDIANDAASAELMMRVAESVGLHPATAFQHIHVMRTGKKRKDGKELLKATFSAHLMQGLAINAGHQVHVSGNAMSATSRLIRYASDETLARLKLMHEMSRGQKEEKLASLKQIYDMERDGIRDRISSIEMLKALGEEPSPEEIESLKASIRELPAKYDFSSIREELAKPSVFDPEKVLHFETTWTSKRAEDAGLFTNTNWTSYRPEMLKNRAKSANIRDGAPEVLMGIRGILEEMGVEFSERINDDIALSSGLYTAEEMGAEVDQEGIPLKDSRPLDEGMENPKIAKIMDNARRAVERESAEALQRWSSALLKKQGVSRDAKRTQIQAIRTALMEAGKNGEIVEDDGTQMTITASLNKALDELD